MIKYDIAEIDLEGNIRLVRRGEGDLTHFRWHYFLYGYWFSWNWVKNDDKETSGFSCLVSVSGHVEVSQDMELVDKIFINSEYLPIYHKLMDDPTTIVYSEDGDAL